MDVRVVARTLLLVGAAAAIAVLGSCGQDNQSSRSVTAARPSVTAAGPSPTVTGPAVPVVKVVDGDTIKVDNAGKITTVRLLGMDTPETVDPRKPVQCFGPQASARAHALLDGQRVLLDYDDTQGRTDKYGRTLAYAWLMNDAHAGTLYEYTMIRNGFAHEYTYNKPYRLQSFLRRAEATAKAKKLGFWSPTTCSGNTTQPAR